MRSLPVFYSTTKIYELCKLQRATSAINSYGIQLSNKKTLWLTSGDDWDLYENERRQEQAA